MAMDPVDFAVPGALLRTAGEPTPGDGQEPDDVGHAPVLTAVRWWDGIPVAVIVLALLGVGVVPLLATIVVVAALATLVVVGVLASRRAGVEERAALVAAGISPDAALAPVARGRVIATAQQLALRRGVRDLLTLAAPVGAACFAGPLFAGRILHGHEHISDGHRLAALALAAVVAAALSPLAARGFALLARNRPDPDRLIAAVTTAWLCVFVGFAALAPTTATIAILLGIGELAAFALARALTRCLVATVAARERPAAWSLLALYSFVVGGLVGTILLNLIATNGHTRAALWLLAPAGALAAAYVAAGTGRRTTARESADVVAAVRERRDTQERDDLGIAPPAVEVRGLHFSYGAQPVLRDINLEVAQGETVALLGTNGAGKSTLLRVVAGLVAPSRGSVRLYGEPTSQVGAEQLGARRIALVLGGGMTFPGLTVAETLRLANLGLPDPAHVEEVYGRFAVLWDRRNQRTGTLSGGEQQMLAVGRALLARPRLLLIDELTLGLAPKIVGDLVDLIRELSARDTTIVLVEQSVNIATRLTTRAFFLERGQVRYDGPTDELLERDDLLRSVFLAGATG